MTDLSGPSPVEHDAASTTEAGVTARDFDWLGDSLESDDCWVSHDWSKAGKTVDIGAHGFTGSVSDWHYLLQMTAPDPKCGVIYARGNYPDLADSILARAQDARGQGSWGFRVAADSEISLGNVRSQGLINYRWPCMSYGLNLKAAPKEQGQSEPESQPFGTLHTCTFVKDGTLFQITALRRTEDKVITEHRLRFSFGGCVRFGCTCSNAQCEYTGRSRHDPLYPLDAGEPSAVEKASISISGQEPRQEPWQESGYEAEQENEHEPEHEPEQDPGHGPGQEPSQAPEELHYALESLSEGRVLSAVCKSLRYHDVRLDMQLFVNGHGIKVDDLATTSGEYRHCIDISTMQECRLQPGTDMIVIGTFSLSAIGNRDCKYITTIPSSREIEDYLGIPYDSDYSTAKLWVQPQEDGIDPEGNAELHMAARCVESVLGVTSVPKVDLRSAEVWEQHGEVQENQLEPSTIVIPESKDTTRPSSLINVESCETLDNAPPPLHRLPSSSSLEKLLRLTDLGEEEDRILNSVYPNISRAALDFEGIAFIANIIGTQYVQWDSMFWQIRLLVKAYTFLTAVELPKDNATEATAQAPTSKPHFTTGDRPKQILYRIRRSYLSKIEFHIREALIWMLSCKEPNFQLATGEFESPRSGCISTFRGVREMTYLATSIWYVLKYCAAALDRRFFAVLLKNLHKLEAIHPFDEPRPSWLSSQSVSPKWQLVYALSRWSHFGCLHEIYKQLADREYHRCSEMTPVWSQVLLGQQKWKGQSEKMLKLLRKAQGDQRPQVDPAQVYTASQDEQLDRFVMLCAELKLDPPGQSLTESCLKQTRAKLGSRKGTTKFNPGTSKTSRLDEICAPWELSCLNHHIRCMALPNIAEDDSSFEAKKNCLAFLNADYTFVRNWDRSKSYMLTGWWDLEVSCVVCSTLLDERTAQNMLANTLSSSAIKPTAVTEFPIVARSHGAEEDTLFKALKDIRQVLQKESQKVDTKLRFAWLEFQPPGYGEAFHPDWLLQSLDDTPELFTQEQIGKLKLRSDVKEYLDPRTSDQQSQEGSGPNLHDKVDAVDTLFLSLFDLSSLPGLELATSISRFGSFEDLLKDPLANPDPMAVKLLNMAQNERKMDPNDRTAAERLWFAHLSHQLDDCQDFHTLTAEDQQTFRESNFPGNWYRAKLLDHLSDSLVDQNVKHRILFSQRFSPSLVKAFIHIWHPQALDALNSHLGSRNVFVDSEGSDYWPWTTSITVAHWGLRPASFPTEYVKRFDEGRKHGEMPPKKLSDLVGPDNKVRWLRITQNLSGKEQPRTQQLEEQASTIVFSGDPKGTFWKCSILSPLFRDGPGTSKDDPELPLAAYVEPVQEIVQLFAHRQAIGRRLSFVMLVGHLCELLAQEYNRIVTHLDNILDISKQVLFDGLDIGKSTKALGKLERLIWGLESFRIFDNALSSSVIEIKLVASAFHHDTKEEREQWDRDLHEKCDKVMEEYSKRSEKLFGVLSQIKYKVEQITRLRDGISSITNVEQSLESLEQNSNIRILTFITIAYLPLSFVAALFSVGWGILPESAGRGLFIGLIVLFFSTTIVMGTLIETLTNFLEEWKEFRKERAEKAQRMREEGWMGRGDGGREEGDARTGEGRGVKGEDWRDVLRGLGLRHRGGGPISKRDERREEHVAWRERFRRRGRRGADVEVGVNGSGGIEELKEC